MKTFDADDKNLPDVIEYIKSPLKEELSLALQNKIELAVEEIFVNIAHYAYEGKNGQVKVTTKVLENPKRLCIEFIDDGIQFNPLEKPDPNISLKAEDREIGGLGIFLTKKFMDKIEYRYENGNNILTIEKNL
ncbi:MAG: ATP-binding protein [Treponema sp.]|nr:ATP-binding protein [Treponema sp.]